MAEINPPTTFFFRVSFEGSANDSMIHFQEISGLSSELNIEEVQEGGENQFKYRLPGVNKFENLELKRGLINNKSSFLKWIQQSLNGLQAIEPKDIKVELVNLQQEHKVVVSWRFVQAYPIKWSLSGFNAMNNNIGIESLSLAYSYFKKNSV